LAGAPWPLPDGAVERPPALLWSVISVIVYGRNDVHGYNAHRRTALSLNCIAELLTDSDDEIVFVDYNTPDELPTLPAALADTLTQRCLSLLRVIRVPARVHRQHFAERTHLPIVEPVARNAGVRRASPSNRWLLSTTTDMVFVPLRGRTLSETCSELPDGFYALPRFELPEWVWEQIPRDDSKAAIAAIADMGPRLRLDEKTLSHGPIRFDAPGDFQLVLRDDFVAIDGFDEEMLLGWHVDSNLSKRLLLHRGSISSLEEDVAGYHCNHTRMPTIYHRSEAANDLNRFFFALDQVELPAQRKVWGLADVKLDEVQVDGHARARFSDAVLATTVDASGPLGPFDARDTKFALAYDSSHVLSFVVDALSVSSPDARVAYVGCNSALEARLSELVARLELAGPLAAADLEDEDSLADLDRVADVFIIDLGIDLSVLPAPLSAGDGSEFATLRARLFKTFRAFRRVVELERARLERGAHPRRFVLVNSAAVFWNAYVLAQLHCSQTTAHSRVRRAVVKAVPDESEAAKGAQARAVRLGRWITRRDFPRRSLEIRPGETVEIRELDHYAGFGDGWAFPDRAAIRTRGCALGALDRSRRELAGTVHADVVVRRRRSPAGGKTEREPADKRDTAGRLRASAPIEGERHAGRYSRRLPADASGAGHLASRAG